MQEKKEPAKVTWRATFWLVIIAVAISAFIGWEFGNESGYDTGYDEATAAMQANLQQAREASYQVGYDDGYAQRELEEHFTITGNAENPVTDSEPQSQTVYITNTGEKYHRAGCQYLRQSQIAISLDDAINQGYTACSRCW